MANFWASDLSRSGKSSCMWQDFRMADDWQIVNDGVIFPTTQDGVWKNAFHLRGIIPILSALILGIPRKLIDAEIYTEIHVTDKAAPQVLHDHNQTYLLFLMSLTCSNLTTFFKPNPNHSTSLNWISRNKVLMYHILKIGKISFTQFWQILTPKLHIFIFQKLKC